MSGYTILSFFIACGACLLVFLRLDHHSTNIRRMMLIAVMTSLSVISRLIFTMIPGFKPMMAIIILTGMSMGSEAGFLCGAFTALVSNIYFGQGPWTPFQMIAFGFIGLAAGFLSKGLKKNVVFLTVYGMFAGCVFSFIMDVWTVLWFDNGFTPALYTAAIITALPYTFAYAISTAVFLLFMRRPVGFQLDRIITKYQI